MNIEEWWPRLDESARRQLVNFPRDPVTPYAMEHVALAGGPAADSEWWEPARGWEEGDVCVPYEAREWIRAQPNTKTLYMKHERDPRADYMGRSWPRRQN